MGDREREYRCSTLDTLRHERGKGAYGRARGVPATMKFDMAPGQGGLRRLMKIQERCAMTDMSQFSVVFHAMDPSDAVRDRGLYLMGKLARANRMIMRGTMTIEGRHRHHHQGNLYHVSLRLHLPGHDIFVTHDPERNHAHEDVYVAMRDACEAARKQLEARHERRAGLS
jgi:Sigma 54 modulation protein / S30EA ribosomal protein